VQVDASAPASMVNTATVSGGADGNPGNNTASDPVTVSAGPDLAIAKTHTGTFTRGQVGAVYTLVVSNVGGQPTAGTVTVTDTLPAGLAATSIAGTGWTCTLAPLACTRSDVLAPGASYPPILVTVNVAANAPATVVNTATVTGGADTNPVNNTASDPVSFNTIVDLTVTKVHTGIAEYGKPLQYVIVVTNSGNAPSVGIVTLHDVLPGGLEAVSLTGSGWTCVLATLTCSRADVLAPGASYPPLTLVTNLKADAPSAIVNQVVVSGGGDVDGGNNTASDAIQLKGGGGGDFSAIPTLSTWALLLLMLLMAGAGMRAGRRRF
jgi:uncharacterized repeat protein (TIGR01451 family)